MLMGPMGYGAIWSHIRSSRSCFFGLFVFRPFHGIQRPKWIFLWGPTKRIVRKSYARKHHSESQSVQIWNHCRTRNWTNWRRSSKPSWLKTRHLTAISAAEKIELFLQLWVSLCGLLVRWGRLAVGWLILSSEFCLNVSLIDWKSLVGGWIDVVACVLVWAGLISLLGC